MNVRKKRKQYRNNKKNKQAKFSKKNIEGSSFSSEESQAQMESDVEITESNNDQTEVIINYKNVLKFFFM